MKRLALTLAVALGLVVSSWTGDAQAGPVQRERFCRYESWDGHRGFTPHEVRLTIYCAENHFNTNIGIALEVAERESGYRCKADNPYSSAAGVYQIVESTWATWWGRISPRFERWNIHNNPHLCRANVLIAVNAAHRWGWGPWA